MRIRAAAGLLSSARTCPSSFDETGSALQRRCIRAWSGTLSAVPAGLPDHLTTDSATWRVGPSFGSFPILTSLSCRCNCHFLGEKNFATNAVTKSHTFLPRPASLYRTARPGPIACALYPGWRLKCLVRAVKETSTVSEVAEGSAKKGGKGMSQSSPLVRLYLHQPTAICLEPKSWKPPLLQSFTAHWAEAADSRL
jgi:hypothetical protein